MTGAEKAGALTIEAATLLAAKAQEVWPQITGAPQLVMHRENTVFRVTTKAGDAALRIHRAGYHTNEAITSELRWMDHLASQDIPVPAPIPTARGALTVLLQTDGFAPRRVDMLTWLGGAPLGQSGKPLPRPLETNLNIFRLLGQTMARFHYACDKWKEPTGFSRHAWDLEGLVGDQPFWGSFWDVSGLDAGEKALLLAARDKARSALSAVEASGADYGLIHADLVRENVLVDGEQLHFIDFDDAGYGFRLFDIATALFKNRSGPDYQFLQQALVEGYLEERPSLRRELPYLPLFMLLRSLTYLGWGEARKAEPGMDARRAGFKLDALGLAAAYVQES